MGDTEIQNTLLLEALLKNRKMVMVMEGVLNQLSKVPFCYHSPDLIHTLETICDEIEEAIKILKM